MTIKSIPRGVAGMPVPRFVGHPRQRPQLESRQKYYYAATSVFGETPMIYRFAYPSDRDLWVAQGEQGTRQALRATQGAVVAAKEAVECGEYEWPTPEWRRTS